MKVNGECIKALVDTVADVSLILKEKVYEIKVQGSDLMGKESIVKIVLTCIVKNIPLEIPFHERYVLQDFDVFLGMDKTISVLRQYLDDFKLPVRHEILGFVKWNW